MQPDTNATTDPAIVYEPPRVEQVLGPDEVAREVHYAGRITDDAV